MRNTNTKIAFRAPFEEDRQIIGGALALDEKQTNALARLENHTAIVKQSDWLEAIQCHIEKVDLVIQQKHNTENATNRETDDERLYRSCVLSALLHGPHIVEAYDQIRLQDWVQSQQLGEKVEQLVLKMIDNPESDLPLDEVRVALTAMPVIGELLRFTQQCSITPRGVINSMVVALHKNTIFRGNSAKEVILKLLLFVQTKEQVAKLIIDMKGDNI